VGLSQLGQLAEKWLEKDNCGSMALLEVRERSYCRRFCRTMTKARLEAQTPCHHAVL
jgi:hypothetical protein